MIKFLKNTIHNKNHEKAKDKIILKYSSTFRERTTYEVLKSKINRCGVCNIEGKSYTFENPKITFIINKIQAVIQKT